MLVREDAKFVGNGAGHINSGADTFLNKKNHGADTFLHKKDHGADTFLNQKNHGVHTYLEKLNHGASTFLKYQVSGRLLILFFLFIKYLILCIKHFFGLEKV